MSPKRTLLPALAGLPLLFAISASSGDQEGAPIELGRVRWQRNLEGAMAAARTAGKPVFALFQEIPGCATCQSFGAGPLSDPLLVEAIEELFVPLAIYNNRLGADAEVLARYDEPSWNNPVVRFLSADGEDLIPRRDRLWSTRAIATRSVQALAAAGADVPHWLEVVVAESESKALASATFAMHCFWQGEVQLGALEGVVTTRAGWLLGREVVEVRYDPESITRERLVATAERMNCTERAQASGGEAKDAKVADRKFHLRRSLLRYLPLTPMQRTKVNSALGGGGDPAQWLSPRQRALLARVERVAPGDSVLEGLQAPDTRAGLAAYERELSERLDASGALRAR